MRRIADEGEEEEEVEEEKKDKDGAVAVKDDPQFTLAITRGGLYSALQQWPESCPANWLRFRNVLWVDLFVELDSYSSVSLIFVRHKVVNLTTLSKGKCSNFLPYARLESSIYAIIAKQLKTCISLSSMHLNKCTQNQRENPVVEGEKRTVKVYGAYLDRGPWKWYSIPGGQNLPV